MTQAAVQTVSSTSSQGWLASLELQLQAINGKTCLLPQARIGPLTVQRPFYPEGDVCHVYVLHPPGGVVGGDQINLHVNVLPDAHGLITTPGASKYYRSAGDTACLQQKFHVSANATLEFLPQESIYFPATQLSAKFLVELDAEAKFVGWEVHSFGLPANNEKFDAGKVVLGTELRLAGKLLLHDKLTIDAYEMNRLSGLRGYPVYGNFVVYSSAINSSLLTSLQSITAGQGNCGVSRVEDDLIVARYLGDSSEAAHRYFRQLWKIIRPLALGLDACEPRIWNT